MLGLNMSKLPTIRVKSSNSANKKDFFIRNADDLRYGEILFKDDEFESLGEHKVRLKLESSPPDEFFVPEAKLWLQLKEDKRTELETADRSDREIETLSIAKEANSIARTAANAARRSSRYAMYAAITAVVMMIADNMDKIIELLLK